MLRKFRYAMFCVPSVWLLAACGAAGPDADPVDTTVDEIVTPGSPPLAATTTTDLPGLPEGIANTPSGSFVPATKVGANAVTVDAKWNASIVGDKFSTPPALPTYLNNSEFLLGSGLSTYWSSNQFAAAIKDYVDVTPANPNPSPKSFGYPAGRVRWLRRDTTAGSTAVTAIPRRFTETQQRGARLFCAAQTAFSQLGNKTILMGKRAVASAKILGKQIDFMAIEPSISMAAPQKVDTGTNDGAQAFIIPMAAGVRLTPLSLTKSSLPELRAPVLLMTGDTDSVSRANMDSTGKKFKEWETLTHFSAFASGNQTLGEKDTPQLTLAVIGPFTITAKFGATMEIASCAQGSDLLACKNTPNGPVKRLLGGTVFNGVTTPRSAAYPPARSGGWTDPKAAVAEGTFNDDAWLTDISTGVFTDADPALPSWALAGLSSSSPMYVRALQDDDKSIEVRTGIKVSSDLSGVIGPITFGPVSFKGQVTGGITVDGAVVHSFREEEEVRMHLSNDPNDDVHPFLPEPITALTDTPSIEANYTFSASAGVDLSIATGLFTFHKSFSLWSKTMSGKPAGTGRWPEKERLRIVTAHDTGTSLTSDAQSHWPRGASFASLPQSMSACLGQTPPVTQLPAPCTPIAPTAPPGGTTVAPVGSICFYYPTNFPMDADSDITQCKQTLSAYAKSAPTKRQTSPQGLAFAGQTVDTHAVNFGPNSADQQAFINAINSCYKLYGNSETSVESEINLAPCDLAGNLITNAIEPVTPTQDPQPTETTIAAPGACQAP